MPSRQWRWTLDSVVAKIAKKQNKAKTTPQRLLVIHNLPTTKTPRGSSCYLPHKTPRAVS